MRSFLMSTICGILQIGAALPWAAWGRWSRARSGGSWAWVSCCSSSAGSERREASREGSQVIAVCFVLSALASVAVTFVYVFGGQPQLEGALLGVALGGIGIGLILIAREFLPHGPFVQERSVIPAQPQAEKE